MIANLTSRLHHLRVFVDPLPPPPVVISVLIEPLHLLPIEGVQARYGGKPLDQEGVEEHGEVVEDEGGEGVL